MQTPNEIIDEAMKYMVIIFDAELLQFSLCEIKNLSARSRSSLMIGLGRKSFAPNLIALTILSVEQSVEIAIILVV